MLQRLQASTGVPVTSDADDPSYLSFNQVCMYIGLADMDTLGQLIIEGAYVHLLIRLLKSLCSMRLNWLHFPNGVSRPCIICQQATKIKVARFRLFMHRNIKYLATMIPVGLAININLLGGCFLRCFKRYLVFVSYVCLMMCRLLMSGRLKSNLEQVRVFKQITCI